MHNIEYYDYPENIHRDYAWRELDYYVKQQTYQEGGHGLDKPIRWLESEPICEDYESAREAISRRDKGWYDQLAVRYKAPAREPEKRSKQQQALEDKEKDAHAKLMAVDKVIWASGLKAEFVSCRSCGSKLKRRYIKSNRCPLCGADLRPESTIKQIDAARARWKKAEKAVTEYVRTHGKKEVRWLVKIEYHT